MELLKAETVPQKKDNLPKIEKVVYPLSFTTKNGESLTLFLQSIWGKGYNAKNSQITLADDIEHNIVNTGKAINTGIKLILSQMPNEEIEAIRTSFFEKESPKTDARRGVVTGTSNRTTTKPSKNTIITRRVIENGIATDDIDDQDQIFEKYKYYANNSTDIRINLNQRFIMNNKIEFLNDIRRKMAGLDLLVEDDSCDVGNETNRKGFEPLIHQMIVKQYLNSFSPYRGLLLYHGLGSGKTCSSIGIIEAMRFTDRKIYVLTPASLQKNYKTQMKFCGNQIFRTNNYWERVYIPTDKSRSHFLEELKKLTYLPLNYLKRQEYVFLINKSKPGISNYDSLTYKDKEALNKQIDLMIDNQFTFINYNGITKDMWSIKYTNSGTINPFHDAVIIIDEGHNFVSRIVNKVNMKQTSVSTTMYDMIMSAENCRVVILSGTPLINYPSELGVLFNLIGGYNYSFEFRVSHNDMKMMAHPIFVKILRKELRNIDFIEYKAYTNVLQVTPNPFGFVRNADGTLTFDDKIGNKKTNELKALIIDVIKSEGYKIIESKTVLYKKFPDEESEFNKLFVGKSNNFVKKEYFQSKIVGMVSYLGDKKQLMPDMVVPEKRANEDEDEDIFIEEIKMNDYVLKQYSMERKKETDIDKRQKKRSQQKNKDAFGSSYRIYSRTACNFVFPETVQKPSLQEINNEMGHLTTEDDLDYISEKEMQTHNDGLYDEADIEKSKHNKYKIKYANEIAECLQLFEDRPSEFFDSDLPKLVKDMYAVDPQNKNNLKKYSPKMFRILENILDNDNIGLHLLYSNFRNLGGIGIFISILQYYGYTQLKVKKTKTISGNTRWSLDLRHPYYDQGLFTNERRFYALYTGQEGSEEKEIIRNIFNGQFDKIPKELRDEIQSNFFKNGLLGSLNNSMGQIIKLLIISASGAEGIDLKNVRFVHIMEPYWHPVRISQVIGRARRICSHTELPQDLRNVKVFMYMLVYDKSYMQERRDDFIELVKNDTDITGKLRSTDERLYEVMKNKKKLMNEFLTAIKEASIDCLVNYDDKSKCLRFPYTRDGIKKLISDTDYKNDRHNVIKKRPAEKRTEKESENSDEE